MSPGEKKKKLFQFHVVKREKRKKRRRKGPSA